MRLRFTSDPIQPVVDLLDGFFRNLSLALEAGGDVVLSLAHNGAQLVVEVAQGCYVEDTRVDVNAVYDRETI